MADEECAFQILSFSQNRTDASIYVGSPSFSDARFLLPVAEDKLLVQHSPGNGKLSLHGSGMVGARAHLEQHHADLVVKGNFLLDREGERAGLRHLFTMLMTQPRHIPQSPALNRASDIVVQTKELAPLVMIFFAIPAVRPLRVTVMASFSADDLEEIPPIGGFGSFHLIHHALVWYCYRTKHMMRWAAEPQVSYHDGFHVPVIIGVGEGEARLELRRPTYSLSNDELTIAF